METGEGSLDAALFVVADGARDHPLNLGHGDAREGSENDDAVDHPSRRGEAVAGQGGGHAEETCEGGAAFADFRNDFSSETALHDCRHQTDKSEGEPGLVCAPSVAVSGIKNPDAGIDLMGDAADEGAGGKAEDEAMFSQFEKGVDGIGAQQAEGGADFRA